MSNFTPKSGCLEIEVFDDPPPKMTMNIMIEFLEVMDPDEPNCEQNAKASFDELAVPFDGWQELAGTTIDRPVIDDVTECTIYYYGYHNPIDLESISFGQFNEETISATLKGSIDFRQEGLGRFGKVEFVWEVSLGFDQLDLED